MSSNSLIRPVNHKIAERAGSIFSDDPEELSFVHSVFCSCALPYRNIDGPAYKRTTGRASLTITSGFTEVDDDSGSSSTSSSPEMVPVGIPYGSKPRLVLLHAMTEAVRRQDREIPIAETLSGYLRKDLGANTDTRTLRGYREQLKRLARASVTVEWRDPAVGKHVIQDAKPFSRLELWGAEGSADAQKELWPSSLTLGHDFFESLMEHAVPLDHRAIVAIQHNARALDLLVWLSHRLHRLKADQFVSWQALHTQFGGATTVDTPSRLKDFSRELTRSLMEALQVYPRARVEKVKGGLKLKKSPPPVKTITVQGTDLLT
jgi:hypothetical protein